MGEAIQVAIQTGKANFPTNSGFVRLFPRTTLPGDHPGVTSGGEKPTEPFETKNTVEQSFFSWFHDMHLEPIFGFSKSYISSWGRCMFRPGVLGLAKYFNLFKHENRRGGQL